MTILTHRARATRERDVEEISRLRSERDAHSAGLVKVRRERDALRENSRNEGDAKRSVLGGQRFLLGWGWAMALSCVDALMHL